MTVQRVGSYTIIVDQCGRPDVERGDPMEEWRSPFEDQNGDLGDRGIRRLSSTKDVLFQSTSASASVASVDFANANDNASEIDLEAGDEWVIDCQSVGWK
jgi:hypothetical protein